MNFPSRAAWRVRKSGLRKSNDARQASVDILRVVRVYTYLPLLRLGDVSPVALGQTRSQQKRGQAPQPSPPLKNARRIKAPLPQSKHGSADVRLGSG